MIAGISVFDSNSSGLVLLLLLFYLLFFTGERNGVVAQAYVLDCSLGLEICHHFLRSRALCLA